MPFAHENLQMTIHSRTGDAFMKKLLLAMIFSGFVSVPVFADSVNVLFGVPIPRGDSDVYHQNEAETTFRVKDLNDFIGSVGYDHFLEIISAWEGTLPITREIQRFRIESSCIPMAGPFFGTFGSKSSRWKSP